MKIKIKRSTTEGIKENDGVLFEAHGYQFCLLHDKKEGWFRAIELSTGYSVNNLDDDYYSEIQAFELLRNDIISHSADDYKIAVKKVRNTFAKRYKFSIPLNQPIIK